MDDRLEAAYAALRRGEIILLYDADGREEETDMVIASAHATPEAVRTLRSDAGGLLCTTLAPEHHRRLALPWLSDLLADAADRHPALGHLAPSDIRYDAAKPAFGLTINHRTTFTGITDADRATTIAELASFLAGPVAQQTPEAFGREFRAPGHVTLLNGTPQGLADRQGHTELSIELLRQAGLTPSATICEMLGPDGQALPRKAAEAYAREHGLVFLTGQDVIDAWIETRPPAKTAPSTRTTAPAPA